jgi:3'-phosphoadenosine 5'-phosphosulfate sulfotransferase
MGKHIRMPRWTVINRRVKRKRNKKLGEMVKDIDTGRDSIMHSSNLQWWGWDAGLTLFFW